MSGVLDVVLYPDGGRPQRQDYVLNSVERECLRKAMDEYCQQQVGTGLAEYGAGIQRMQEAVPSKPLTDFDMMALYAQLGVIDMAIRYLNMVSGDNGSLSKTDAAHDTEQPTLSYDPPDEPAQWEFHGL